MDLSIIIPLYNEEDSVEPLYRAIVAAADGTGLEYEMLFVDDGSRDGTFARAAELAADDRRLRVIKFRRNYGQTPAMVAGIEHAVGDILITMDGDLQNDPADIPALIERVNAGYDVVVGWRFERQDKLVTRKIPSRIANWLIGKVTGVPIRDNGCSLKAFRRNIIQNVPLYSEMHRFIPAMTSITGARYSQIKVRHHARQFGESKYGLSRIYKVLLDLLTIKTIIAFSGRPLGWFAMLALPVMLLSAACLVAGVLMPNPDYVIGSLPIFGVGLMFASLSFFLILGGALGELIYKTGDLKIDTLSALTLRHVRTRVITPETRT